jgi:hypothetical protein
MSLDDCAAKSQTDAGSWSVAAVKARKHLECAPPIRRASTLTVVGNRHVPSVVPRFARDQDPGGIAPDFDIGSRYR